MIILREYNQLFQTRNLKLESFIIICSCLDSSQSFILDFLSGTSDSFALRLIAEFDCLKSKDHHQMNKIICHYHLFGFHVWNGRFFCSEDDRLVELLINQEPYLDEYNHLFQTRNSKSESFTILYSDFFSETVNPFPLRMILFL